ncbi:uncharacterized protein LOC106180292 [Lingula anatina]|uniref:Uncharacterized protein LOC106180292 n=1 Tax=Lingula anatina TaxID=7574 RepID=A0A1S3KB85_LINAN|nr:uncharacterized protein LOC106180292 [Lingula anatina]|eukprot:XP_013419699.1 uncharacterized protein LOC106180292 [Lingula anatina]
MSVYKTLCRVRECYVWKGMRKHISKWVKRCPTCLAHKSTPQRTTLGELPMPAYPFQIVGMDLIGPFQESPKGNRNSVSSVTGFTPFFLVYGRNPRMPLSTLVGATNNHHPLKGRLSDLSDSLTAARDNLQAARLENKRRFDAKANANKIEVGDSVIIFAPDNVTFGSKWDPMWTVTRQRGNVFWVSHQQTGKSRVVNRDKLRLVDRGLAWDQVRPRARRVFKRRPNPVRAELQLGTTPVNINAPRAEVTQHAAVSKPDRRRHIADRDESELPVSVTGESQAASRRPTLHAKRTHNTITRHHTPTHSHNTRFRKRCLQATEQGDALLSQVEGDETGGPQPVKMSRITDSGSEEHMEVDSIQK